MLSLRLLRLLGGLRRFVLRFFFFVTELPVRQCEKLMMRSDRQLQDVTYSMLQVVYAALSY